MASPRRRRGAPCSRACKTASRLVICQPAATAGTTTLGLKQPNAAATTSPGTWPMQAPRLVKYDFSSGRATPSWLTGLPANPSAS